MILPYLVAGFFELWESLKTQMLNRKNATKAGRHKERRKNYETNIFHRYSIL